MRILKYVLSVLTLLTLARATEVDVVDASWMTNKKHQIAVAENLYNTAKQACIENVLKNKSDELNDEIKGLLQKYIKKLNNLSGENIQKLEGDDWYLDTGENEIHPETEFCLEETGEMNIKKQSIPFKLSFPIKVKVTCSVGKATPFYKPKPNFIDVSNFNKIYGPGAGEKAIAQAKAQFFK